MGKYFRIFYLYIVSLVTLCMIVVGIVGSVNSAVSYKFPVVYNYSVYDNGTGVGTQEKISSEEKIAKRTSLKQTFTYLSVLACGAPLFAFHWNQIKKESDKEV